MDISALSENEGVLKPDCVNKRVLINKKSIPISRYVSEISKGNRVYLSKAITLIESTKSVNQSKGNDILKECLKFPKKETLRIGITGVPGVGKSTFIEAFGTYLTNKGRKVAVLAVDPSSSITKGSILGDKTRMGDLVKNPDAFIRPSPSGESLGGVARKTRETVMLCEAAGFDTVLIETVGVGQSETVVHSMVDFFLLLKLAGAGDQLQGIKRGIIEMADAIVINKADGENIRQTKLAKIDFKRALQMYPAKDWGWVPKVTTCSALHNSNIDGVWDIIMDYVSKSKQHKAFQARRKTQSTFWLTQTIEDQLKREFYSKPEVIQALFRLKYQVEQGVMSPFDAANELLSM